MTQTTEDRLAALRDGLKAHDLQGFIVPISDEHMSEYVGDYAQRLAWLMGFTGSAGTGAVLEDAAALFVDGRYTVQAEEQVASSKIDRMQIPAHRIETWLQSQAKEGDKIGFDPWLHTITWARQAKAALKRAGADLVATNGNPIDELWTGQPNRPAGPIQDHPLDYAGQSREDKLSMIADETKQRGADACVIASLDGVCWALNVRGSDISHCPVAYGFLIVPAEGRPVYCVQKDGIDESLDRQLSEDVDLVDYNAFPDTLKSIADGGTIQLDPATAVAALFDLVKEGGGNVLEAREPTTLAKACKNKTERSGTRAAHVRDGIAVTRFLKWFDEVAPRGGLTELAAADTLALQRSKANLLKDLSFRTISAAGPHAALPHYSVTDASNIEIPINSLYLVDSGGQYLDGTTDITRTIQVGTIPDISRIRYTQVLKGHIAVATARFPKGTPGSALDPLARHALWQVGADYDHGTGHGVGSFLNVHEGPQRIAKAGSDEPLQEGMILSNEPGYYRSGEFGIRIENLVLVTVDPQEDDERTMLAFETLTLAPIDTRPIVRDLLTVGEIDWLNQYHARVRREIGPELPEDCAAWCERAAQSG